MKRLYRSQNKVFAGVCGGIAEYFEIDPAVVRLIAGLGIIFSCFTAVLVYFIAWLIIPEAPH